MELGEITRLCFLHFLGGCLERFAFLKCRNGFSYNSSAGLAFGMTVLPPSHFLVVADISFGHGPSAWVCAPVALGVLGRSRGLGARVVFGLGFVSGVPRALRRLAGVPSGCWPPLGYGSACAYRPACGHARLVRSPIVKEEASDLVGEIVRPADIPQVHAEFCKKGQIKTTTEGDRESWQEDIFRMLMDHEESKKEGLKSLKEKLTERESAYGELRALDHTLRLCGCSLAAFVPAENEDGEPIVTKRLAKDEERHVVSARSKPSYKVPEDIGDEWKRVIIKNTTTEQARFELLEFVGGERPLLSLQCDEGSKFFSGLWFLSLALRARVAWLRDPAHRAWNDWKLAMAEAGMDKLKHEGLVLLNFRFAPFMSEGFFAQLKEGLKHWLKVGSLVNELFSMLYGKISKDQGRHTDVTFGALAHMNEIFQGLETDPAFKSKGEKTALRSFWKWPRQMLEIILPSWYSLFLIITHLGLKMGLFTPAACPVWGGSSGAVQFKATGGKLGAAASSSSSAPAPTDEKAEAERVTCSNTMHFVSMVLASEKKFQQCTIVANVSCVCSVVHALEQKKLTSPAAVKEYYCKLAEGRYKVHLRQILEKAMDVDLLDKLGVGDCADMQLPKRATIDNCPLLAAAVKEELATLKELWTFSFALCRWRALSLSHYDMSMPGQFALLLSDQPSVKEKGLRRASELWDAMTKAEEIAKRDKAVASLLDAAACTNFTFVRETLLALRQWSFRFVPCPVVEDLELLFGGFGHSCIDEEAFNRIKDHQRDSKNLRMSRIKRWQWPVLAGVFDRYSRREVSPESAEVPTAAPRRLPGEMFEGLAGEPSVKDEVLKRITGVASWKSPTPTGAHNIVAALQLLIFCSQQDDWEAASKGWKSIFAVVGSLLKEKSGDKHFLVMASNQYGVLGLPVAVTGGKPATVAIPPAKDFAARWFPVLDFSGYQVWEVELVGPVCMRESAARCPGRRRLCGVARRRWTCCRSRPLAPSRVSPTPFSGACCSTRVGTTRLARRCTARSSAWSGCACPASPRSASCRSCRSECPRRPRRRTC